MKMVQRGIPVLDIEDTAECKHENEIKLSEEAFK